MTKLREEVTEFHHAFGQEVRAQPGVPDERVVRLRARLILEESFEAVEALMPFTYCLFNMDEDKERLLEIIGEGTRGRTDAVAVADALADLDYVVEGTRLAFGIDGEPIAREVHRANMAKLGAGNDEFGKKQKPAGWTPPDVERELVKQGWVKP